MYTIKRVVDLVGLPSDTIRAWEKRYGLPRPERSPGGYRLYSADDVSLLRRMRELVDAGLAPSQAAAQLRETAEEPAASASLTPQEFVARMEAGEWPQAELVAFLRRVEARRSLARAADEWLMPLMAEVGRGWSRGSLSMLQEHAVSATVVRQLAMAYENAGPQPGPHALVGLPPGSTHEIGVLLFAVLLRQAGVDARYLGADVPVQGWLDAVAAGRPVLAITACHRPDDVAATRELVEALRQVPGLRVLVGGARQGDCPDADPLGHRFAQALDEVLAWLGEPTAVAGSGR